MVFVFDHQLDALLSRPESQPLQEVVDKLWQRSVLCIVVVFSLPRLLPPP